MPLMRTTITHTGATPDVLVREHNGLVKQANFATVAHWHATYMPGHFQVAAESQYGYRPRKGQNEPAMVPSTRPGREGRMMRNRGYWHRKRREKGHVRPLVWSGRSERAARQVRISGTSKQARGVFTALPRYFYQYRTDIPGGTPDKAAELVTVAAHEVLDLVAQHQRALMEGIATLRATRTTEIR